ncbi:hypothetical protein T265_02064 [Opisthorchis viverrini]|uniref:ACB domain-containing protein n=1 Tax=Opisthorchis viverrini TaxID=6198 RepID=A0A074ZWK1_OPIVI|nr:hypothetical protein T265_02064 [Opisthorchis viverrini]KER31838.1 hypothetical protein T265_02064 [Opisthorchis viverrini]
MLQKAFWIIALLQITCWKGLSEEAAGLDTDPGKLAALKTLLKVRAKAALDAARRDPWKIDWAVAKEAFAAEFGTPAERQEAMRLFTSARMAPGWDAPACKSRWIALCR